MSDRAIVLVGSGYFLGCPRPCLTEAKDANGVFSGNVFIEDAIDVFPNGASTRGTFV